MRGTKSFSFEVEFTDVFVSSSITWKRYSFLKDLKKTTSDSNMFIVKLQTLHAKAVLGICLRLYTTLKKSRAYNKRLVLMYLLAFVFYMFSEQ